MYVGAMSMSEMDQKISSLTIGNKINLFIVKMVLGSVKVLFFFEKKRDSEIVR